MEKLQKKLPEGTHRARKWRAREQAAFFRFLGDMLASGFSMQQCLKSLGLMSGENADDIRRIEERLSGGEGLSDALRDYIDVSTYFQLAIAERHGDIDRSVKQLGQCLERRVVQQSRLRGVLVYPAALLCFLAVIAAGMKFLLMPELKQFESMGGGETGFDWQNVLKWIIMVVLVIAAVYFARVFRWWSRQKALTRHDWYCGLPVIGRVYRQYCYYYLTFNLGMMLQSGLDFREICQLLGQFGERTLMHQLGEQIDQCFSQGRTLSEVIAAYPFMPGELDAFFSSGETREELSRQLLVYSEAAYKKLVRQIDGLISLIQPLLFLLIALVIIGCYLAMLLPLYSSLGGMY